MTDLSLELGELRGRLAALEVLVTESRADTKRLLAMANEVRGGWKTIMLVSGFAGAIGALMMKLATFAGVFR